MVPVAYSSGSQPGVHEPLGGARDKARGCTDKERVNIGHFKFNYFHTANLFFESYPCTWLQLSPVHWPKSLYTSH